MAGMRKLIGTVVIIIGLLFYIVAMMEIGTRLINTPWWVQAVFYCVAGVAWALPLRPVMAWIQQPSSTARLQKGRNT